MSETPKGWTVIHKGSGRGCVTTRVQFADGRGINFSGRLTYAAAVDQTTTLLRQWTELDMLDAALGSFKPKEGKC
jgi:hypothetical protein